MSWLPLLLAVWIVVDVLVVAGFVALSRRRTTQQRTRAVAKPRTQGLGGMPTSRLVH